MIGTQKEVINWALEQDKDKKLEIKIYRPKRGLKANAYYWELENELANVLRVDNEFLHFLLLQKYGQVEMVSVRADIDVSGYFKYYCEAGESSLNGIKFKHYKVFKGSSEMDSREMSILIDGLVQECKEQGIETRPDEEVKSMLEEWK
jgi:hypothetical protein